MPEYELLVASVGDRRRILWDGATAEDAAKSYVASHPAATVLATRAVYPAVHVMPRRFEVIEPGASRLPDTEEPDGARLP